MEIPGGILERVRALCLALPEVTVRVDEARISARSTAWSFDLRSRSLCLLVAVRDPKGAAAPRLVLRVDPQDRRALASIGDPYYCPRSGARDRDRIGVRLTDSTDWTEIRELITESYRLIAPKKLTRQLP